MHRRLEGRKKLRELRDELQEAFETLQTLTAESASLKSPEGLAEFERSVKAATDRVQSLAVAVRVQQTLMDESFHEEERSLFGASPKKWKNYGYRPVAISTLGGLQVTVMARYFATHRNRARKGKGAFPGVLLLGVCEDCTPALASEVAQLAAALSSFDDARERLATMGIGLSVRKISQVAYHFSQRARRQQQVSGMGIGDTLAGRRVVISTDGGRLRVRRNKRGKKTAKGRSRYHTEWREPKLLVIYVVEEDGRMSKEFTPVLDGTLKGPDAVFDLLAGYLAELNLTQADRVLFIADGAKWIWNRVSDLWNRLGVRADQCLELVDYYHVVEHLGVLAGLKKWSASAKKQWITRQRRRLLDGDVDGFVAAVKSLSKGRRGKDWRRERDYLLRNAQAGRLNYAEVRAARLPIGSGTMESTVRRVVNLRLKGASLFWTEEHAEDMLLLRAYYKAKHWKTLENKAFTQPHALAA